jgi:predicted acylesterase/phospholipase RssA
VLSPVPADKVGVAMSGGGHRATLFGLGVLLYLADAEQNRNVVSISSVSGGSLTNAYVGLECDYPAATAADFRSVARRLAGQISTKGTLFAWSGTWIYVTALGVSGLGIFLVWLLPWYWLLRLALFIVALAAWDFVLLRRRGIICGWSYASTLFRRGGSVAKLGDIRRDSIDHVVCATHLHAGEHMYFSGKFVYAYRFGWGTPGDLPLHVPVQASTAVPGAFPPRWVRSARLGLHGATVPRLIALADGGVYDNMADQWFSGFEHRQGVPAGIKVPGTFIIANASASMGMEPVSSFELPLIGEVAALKRSSSIMYDNSASIRKSDLVQLFDAAAAGSDCARFGIRGALLDIRSDPFAAAGYFSQQAAAWPDRAARARAALTRRPSDWSSDGEWAAARPTDLSKWGVQHSARLLRHAYALAAVNLHVLLDFPLVDLPPLQSFEELCR